MGFRFRRSVKLAPGVRLNVSPGGMSVTAGMRGASINVGKRGAYANLGIPGTGISSRTKISAGSQGSRPTQPQSANLSVRLVLRDSGEVEILNENGTPLPTPLVKVLREQQADRLQSWLNDQCEQWNQGIERLLNLHLDTQAKISPPPSESFPLRPPSAPSPRAIAIFDKVIPGRRAAIEQENAEAQATYDRARADWQAAAAAHDQIQTERRNLHERSDRGEIDAMTTVLEQALAAVTWPRETNVSLEIGDDARTVYLDVDLPELDDLPTQEASVAGRGLRLNIRPRSETRRQKEYAQHVHAVAFRVVGTVFAALPPVERVVFSGYSQRPDRATGQVVDEYLLSASIERAQWSMIDFKNLTQLDVIAAFDRFDLRRKMNRSGAFSPIEPFAVSA
jgi:hypothetical protein